MSHVFAYGSLMFEPVWRHVVAGNYRHGPAQLRGFERFAVRDQTYPGVVRADSPLATVNGVVYFDVDAADLARLDRFEGAEYRRISVPVYDVRYSDDPQVLQASLYLYLPDDQLLAQPWDAANFEQVTMSQFIARFCPSGSPSVWP